MSANNQQFGPKEWCYTKDALFISKSDGGISNTVVEPWEIHWDELLNALRQPDICRKDGPYLVRCTCENNLRANENAKTGNLIVLDGDSRLDLDTGEILKGAPDPHLVHEILSQLDITHVICSSHSNQFEGKGNRYRVLLPARIPNQATLVAVVSWLIYQLQAEGVMLNNVKENLTFTQGWFTPRCPDQEHKDKYVFLEHDGLQSFPIDEANTWWAHQVAESAPALAASGCSKKLATGAIGKFIADHGTDWMLATLIDAGYHFKNQSGMNGHSSYRLLHPDSTSGEPGVHLFKTNKDVWRAFSHHGDYDPLSGNAEDAFGLFVLFQHHGDKTAAMDAVNNLYPGESETQEYFELVNLDDLMIAQLDPPSYVIEPVVVRNQVTLLGGHGGSGKSWLALVWAVHVACGVKWGPFQVNKGRAVFVSMEDPTEWVRYRLRKIIIHYQLDPVQVKKNLRIIDATQVDALAVEQMNKSQRTLAFKDTAKKIMKKCEGFDLVVIDNASDAFAADENNRFLVRSFIRQLANLVRPFDGAVLLLAHIDKAAARTSSKNNAYSGSTAWHNSSRSRLAIVNQKLVHEKNNAGERFPHGVGLKFTNAGVLIPVDPAQLQLELEAQELADIDAVLCAIKQATAAHVLVPSAIAGPCTAYHVLSTQTGLPIKREHQGQKRTKTALLQLESDGLIEKSEVIDKHRNKKKVWKLK